MFKNAIQNPFKSRVFLNLWFAKPMVLGAGRLSRNTTEITENDENDENDEDKPQTATNKALSA